MKDNTFHPVFIDNAENIYNAKLQILYKFESNFYIMVVFVFMFVCFQNCFSFSFILCEKNIMFWYRDMTYLCSSDGRFWSTASWSFETFVNQFFWNGCSKRISNCQSHVISVNKASLRHNCRNFHGLLLGGDFSKTVNHASSLRSPPSGEPLNQHLLFFLISDQFHQFVDIFNETVV